MVGYNVQNAVDTKHHLIDEDTKLALTGASYLVCRKQARAAIGSETIEAVADRGYYSGEEIVACEQAGITSPSAETDYLGPSGERPVWQAGLRLCRRGRRLSLSRRRAANLSLHR